MIVDERMGDSRWPGSVPRLEENESGTVFLARGKRVRRKVDT